MDGGAGANDGGVPDATTVPPSPHDGATVPPADADSGAATELAISDVVLPAGGYDKPYEFVIPYTGGSSSPTFRIKSGKLPKGTGLQQNGSLFGTPYEFGDYSFEIEATAGEETVTRSFSWRVTTRLWLAYEADDDEPGVEDIYLADIGGGAPYAHYSLGKADYYEWIDSSTFAMTVRSGDLSSVWTVDASTKPPADPRKVWEGPSKCFWQWSPDGKTFSVLCDNRLSLQRLADGSSKTFPANGADYALWTRDSAAVVMGTYGPPRGVFKYAVVHPDDTTATIDWQQPDLGEERDFVSLRLSPRAPYLMIEARSSTTFDSDYYLAPLDASQGPPKRVTGESSQLESVDIVGWRPDGIVYAERTPSDLNIYASNLTDRVLLATTPTKASASVQLVHDDAVAVRSQSGTDTHVQTYFFDGKTANYARNVVSTAFVVAPDQQRTLVVADHGSGQVLELGYRLDWGTLELNAPSSGTTITDFIFSPDSSRVFFCWEKIPGARQPYYADLRSGYFPAVPLRKDGNVRYGNFSPEGSFISYYVEKDGPVDLELVDIRAQVQSAPMKVNGKGRVDGWTWQPSWP